MLATADLSMELHQQTSGPGGRRSRSQVIERNRIHAYRARGRGSAGAVPCLPRTREACVLPDRSARRSQDSKRQAGL